jgi:NitT/TauT family transport system substrate-binding protein
MMLLVGPVPADQVLRLGTNVWPGYEPLYLASEQEDWPRRLGVRLVEYPSATEVLRAFRNRTLEGAALTLDEVLMLEQADVPVQVVAILDISAGGDVILAKPEIRSFDDLKGRRVAVESGALGAYMVTRALELNDMNVSDVEIVHLDISVHERAFRSGQVDAVVTFEPVKTRLLAADARELFSSMDIYGEIVDVLVIHRDVLAAQPQQVRAVIAGWFRALQRMRQSPAETARFTAQRLKITPQQVLDSYGGIVLPDVADNRRLLNGGLQETLHRMRQTLLDRGLLSRPASIEELLNSGYLPR